jgi:hypothetical protein
VTDPIPDRTPEQQAGDMVRGAARARQGHYVSSAAERLHAQITGQEAGDEQRYGPGVGARPTARSEAERAGHNRLHAEIRRQLRAARGLDVEQDQGATTGDGGRGSGQADPQPAPSHDASGSTGSTGASGSTSDPSEPAGETVPHDVWVRP